MATDETAELDVQETVRPRLWFDRARTTIGMAERSAAGGGNPVSDTQPRSYPQGMDRLAIIVERGELQAIEEERWKTWTPRQVELLHAKAKGNQDWPAMHEATLGLGRHFAVPDRRTSSWWEPSRPGPRW